MRDYLQFLDKPFPKTAICYSSSTFVYNPTNLQEIEYEKDDLYLSVIQEIALKENCKFWDVEDVAYTYIKNRIYSVRFYFCKFENETDNLHLDFYYKSLRSWKIEQLLLQI